MMRTMTDVGSSAEFLAPKLDNMVSDFYNYFQYGLDFYLSGSTHTVQKIILHSNVVRNQLPSRLDTTIEMLYSLVPTCFRDTNAAHGRSVSQRHRRGMCWVWMELRSTPSQKLRAFSNQLLKGVARSLRKRTFPRVPLQNLTS